MQGLPWINAAKLWYAKVFWVFLLLCGIAGMTLHLYSLIDQFLQFDVQVSISLGFNHLVLPAVTVCNVNAVKKSELNIMSEALQSLVAQTDPSRFNVVSLVQISYIIFSIISLLLFYFNYFYLLLSMCGRLFYCWFVYPFTKDI